MVKHIWGKDNLLSDALSRNHLHFVWTMYFQCCHSVILAKKSVSFRVIMNNVSAMKYYFGRFHSAVHTFDGPVV